VALCACVILPIATPAFGVTNAAIRAKRQQAVSASKKEQALGSALESRGEELAEIEAKVESTRELISSTEADLATATADLAQSEWLLDRRASSIYRNGLVSPMSVLGGREQLLRFRHRLELMRRIGNSDASIVSSVKDARAAVESTKRSLEVRQNRADGAQSSGPRQTSPRVPML